MSFLGHLEELRWLLVRSCIAILITSIVAVIFNEFIFDVIIFGPKNGDFATYQFFCDIAKRFDLDQSFCDNELPFEIQNRTMDHRWVYLRFSLYFVGNMEIYQSGTLRKRT